MRLQCKIKLDFVASSRISDCVSWGSDHCVDHCTHLMCDLQLGDRTRRVLMSPDGAGLVCSQRGWIVPLCVHVMNSACQF